MAWWALYKWFRPFRKIPYINWIQWYCGYLYDVWFESLSDDEKKLELDRIRKRKEKRKRESEQALMSFDMMFNVLNNATHGHMEYLMDVYDSASKPLKSKYW